MKRNCEAWEASVYIQCPALAESSHSCSFLSHIFSFNPAVDCYYLFHLQGSELELRFRTLSLCNKYAVITLWTKTLIISELCAFSAASEQNRDFLCIFIPCISWETYENRPWFVGLKHRNLFSHSSWRLESLRSRCGKVWFLLEPLCLACRWPSSPCVLTWMSLCMCLCPDVLVL